jgi:exosome complex RNA-binding protein Rrp42 (RNase PH superfamily)
MVLDLASSCVIGAVSTASGSALIRLGDTTIVCGIKAETAEPDWDRPNEGWLGAFSPINSADISFAEFEEKRLCYSTKR